MPRTETPGRVTPARQAAFTVVRRVFEEGAYADRALRAEADRLDLDSRDRALATAIAYGVVQRRATLDHLAERLAGRPASRLDAPTLAALRVGLLQIAFLDGIPAHAAVDEAVELAKAGRGSGLVNAVLRRAVGEAPALLAALDDDTPAAAALRHSHPRWIVDLWWDALGAEETRALLARDNEPAESALRANTLVTTPEALAGEVGGRPVPGIPGGRRPRPPFRRARLGALRPGRADAAVPRVHARRAGPRSPAA